MEGAAGTEEYRNAAFLMKKLLKWLWYSVLGLAAIAIVLIILFFILIFVSGPPVNEESDERNTTELLRDVDANFEAKVLIKLPSSPLPCDKMVLLGTADDYIYSKIQY